MHQKNRLLGLVGLLLLASATVFGADNVKGMIIGRAGDVLTVKTDAGNVKVQLTDETKTKDDRGLFGYDEQQSDDVLIPGLKLEVEGTSGSEGMFVAKTITVDGDDLETSELIQAGVQPTAEQVMAQEKLIAQNQQNIAANAENIERLNRATGANLQDLEAQKKRINDSLKEIEDQTNRFLALTDYDVKGQATIKFDVGSSTLSEQDQQQLQTLAQSAILQMGYFIEVVGYADATGTAKMNEKLSEDRAKAVVGYLIQQCGVPVRRVIAPGAMGIYQPVATNETKEGRAENRRVEIKVLTNKAA
jgi:OmpA-OmpF porin, OOP family